VVMVISAYGYGIRTCTKTLSCPQAAKQTIAAACNFEGADAIFL
jgi:hypothetical protein